MCVCVPQTNAQKESKKKFQQPLRGNYKCIFLCLRHINKRDYKTGSESKPGSLTTIGRREVGRGLGGGGRLLPVQSSDFMAVPMLRESVCSGCREDKELMH